MLRQAAFEGENALLEGGLHCHTTRSDGKGTPEEVIAMHAQHGYDFLALTDHRTYNYKDYLPESGVLIIPGMEFDRTITNHHRVHCFHTVWIGPEKPENPYEQDQPFQRGYVQDQYEFQQFLDEAHRNKQLTIYCHPQWSGTFAREFERLQGNFAMELWNSGCVMEDGVDFNNDPLWDELLCQGKRIFGVATDDGHAMEQHCRGWVRVNAQKNVNDILRALRASEKAPGHDRIYTAGEKEHLVWLERRDKGVPVGDAVQKEILAVRDELKLPYTFPFENK